MYLAHIGGDSTIFLLKFKYQDVARRGGRAPLELTDTLLVLYSSCLLEGLFVCLKSFDCLMYLHLHNNNNNHNNNKS